MQNQCFKFPSPKIKLTELTGHLMDSVDDLWGEYIKGLLKAELVRRKVSYSKLSEKLKDIGISEDPKNLINKINRGKFSASFLFGCLYAIGCREIRIEDPEKIIFY